MKSHNYNQQTWSQWFENLTKVSSMKRYMRLFSINILVMDLVLIGFSNIATASGVCSSGTGEPPFLSYGAQSNLLMLLDNSGSMLDMAYTDSERVSTANDEVVGSSCYDNPDDARGYLGYDPAKSYAGYFVKEQWYTWNNGIDLWSPGTNYGHRSLVYDNGIVYQAECVEKDDGTGNFVVPLDCDSESTATSLIDDDDNINWLAIPGIVEWQGSKSYSQGDFARYGSQLF